MADLNADLIAGGFLDQAAFQLDFTHADLNADLLAGGALDMAGFQLDLTHADRDADLIVIGGGADLFEPLISNILPATPGPIERTQIVSFDVTDETVLYTIVILASFNGGQQVEVVYDGDGFRGFYRGANNTITAIDDGYSFTILRDGGWDSGPTIEYLVKDKFNFAVIA